jgi:hypothetical protein
MENPVTLKIDGFKDREVLSMSYSFDRSTNTEGQTSGVPRGGQITVKVRAMNDGNPELLKWMTSDSLAKKGSIEFLKTTDWSKMKSIEFEDAYCINFQEKWEDKQVHFEEITITCKKLVNGPVTHEMKWV